MNLSYSIPIPKFTVKEIDILNVTRDKNTRFTFKNGRGKHGIIYVSKGRVSDSFAGAYENIDLTEGELLFIPKGVYYTCTYLDDGTETKIIQFDTENGKLPEYLQRPRKLEIPSAREKIDAFLVPLKSQPFYYMSCLYELLWQIDERYSGIPRKYKKLQSAINEMLANSEKNMPISYYAGLCDMSEVNFRRLFREYTGKTPIEYRNDMRLQKARVKLQSGEYNVSEAAECSGFSNLSFFIKLYKKKYGHTPKKE